MAPISTPIKIPSSRSESLWMAPCHHLLAGSIFTQNQDRSIGGGNDPDILFQFFNNIRCTQDMHKGHVPIRFQGPGHIPVFLLFLVGLFQFQCG